MCFQEHLLKPAAFVKHVILEELTSIGDILSQKLSGLYFVCTGEYDPKEKKFYLLSAKHPKSLHQLSCVEETFKCGSTRMIFVAQYSRAVKKSIRNFAVSLLRRSTSYAKKAVFSRITAPLSFLFIIVNVESAVSPPFCLSVDESFVESVPLTSFDDSPYRIQGRWRGACLLAAS